MIEQRMKLCKEAGSEVTCLMKLKQEESQPMK
jgi:hypothetical protein